MIARWNKYWFGEASFVDLAVLRILAVGMQLFYMLNEQFSDLEYVYSLPRETYSPLPLLRILLSPWGASTIPPSQTVFAVYGLSLVAGVAGLLGLVTNVSLIVFAIGCLFLQTFVFSFHQYHHPEAILLIALLAIALGPSGRVLSVDSTLRGRTTALNERVSVLEYRGEFAGWPVKLVQWLFPLVYLSAVIAKVAYNHYSLDWANGFTLQYYMIQDNIRKDLPLALFVSQFHLLILLGQYLVLAYQATYWLAVPFARLRWFYIPIGVIFHLANYFILYAPFPQWIVLLSAYIPWSRAVERLTQLRVARTAVARPDP